jgi:hypothetical protein
MVWLRVMASQQGVMARLQAHVARAVAHRRQKAGRVHLVERTKPPRGGSARNSAGVHTTVVQSDDSLLGNLQQATK